MITRVFTTLFILCLCMPVNAHEVALHYDHVSLSASASQEVPQDELQVTLYAVSEADDAKPLRMRSVTAFSKHYPS